MIHEKNEDLRIECITNLKKRLIKIESYQEDSNEIEIMVNNIETFLQCQQVKNTKQLSIGHEAIF